MTKSLILPNRIYQADGLHAMEMLPPKSIDLILCDLPYGVTQNEWDKVIPFELLWKHYSRVIKDHGAIVLTATFAFGAELYRTATVPFRYDLVWKKNKSTGFLNANRMPLRQHELILVFYKKLPVYHPQKTTGHKPVNSYTKHTSDGSNYGKTKQGIKGGGQTDRYPTSIVEVPVVNNDSTDKFHSTQKPVELFEWIIRTYTDEGAFVLDNCIGSGTTAEACLNTNRQFYGFEINATCVERARQRIANIENRIA